MFINETPTHGSKPLFEVKPLIETLDHDHPLVIFGNQLTGIT
jgi:hypothetical protein